MKLETLHNNLETSGNFTSDNFRIEINEVTFDLLLNKIYKDAPSSVVREITCNALDAHVVAGTTHIPVEINLDSIDYNLTVKDYGTGLSESDMLSLYCSLFASNKRSDNSTIGGFGLGSKSPFSITDQFSVESRHNGEKSLYAIFKTENNIPAIAKLSTAPSNEPSGLTIHIPLGDYSRYSDFRNAIRKVCPWFGNTVTTNLDHIPTIHTIYENQHGKLVKNTGPICRDLVALIGNVAYKLDAHSLNFISSSTYNWQCSVVLYFNIGDLPITPNREDINYTPKALETLKEKWRCMVEQISADMPPLINSYPTYDIASIKTAGIRRALNSMKLWSPMLRHDSQPELQLTDFLTLPIPDDSAAYRVFQGRRQSFKIGKLDRWTLNGNEGLHIYIMEGKSRPKDHFTECTRYIDTSNQHVIITNMTEEKLTELTNALPIDVEVTRLPALPKHHPSNKPKIANQCFRELNKEPYANTPLSAHTHYVLADDSEIIHTQHHFLAEIYGSRLRTIIIPNSRSNVIKHCKLSLIEDCKEKLQQYISDHQHLISIWQAMDSAVRYQVLHYHPIHWKDTDMDWFIRPLQFTAQQLQRTVELAKHFQFDLPDPITDPSVLTGLVILNTLTADKTDLVNNPQLASILNRAIGTI